MSVPFVDQWTPNGPFGIVKDEDIEGGLRVIEWDLTTYPGGVDAALNALVPAQRRKAGMVIKAHETDGDTWLEREWNDILGDWQVSHTASALQHGFGVIGSGLDVTGYVLNGTSVTVNEGQVVTWDGNVFELNGTQNISAVAAAGIYAICYDSAIDAIYLKLLTAVVWGDFPLAIVRVNASNQFNLFADCRMFANGQKSRHQLTVGPAGTANFTTVRKALLWANAFPAAQGHPREIVVTGDITEPFVTGLGGCISLNASVDPLMTNATTNLAGLRIIGRPEQASGNYPTILFGAASAQGSFMDMNSLANAHIEGLRFDYAGDEDSADDQVCVLQNPGKSFCLKNCQCRDTISKLTRLIYWQSTAGDIELGGHDTNDAAAGTIIEDLHVDEAIHDARHGLYLEASSGAIEGMLSLRNVSWAHWGSSGSDGGVLRSSSRHGRHFHVSVDSLNIVGCRGSVFDIHQAAVLSVANSRLWFSNVSYDDVNTCENASFVNCAFRQTSTNKILLKGSYYSGCHAQRLAGHIYSVANFGGSAVDVTSYEHGMSNGDVVEIFDTTSYNGTWTISDVTTDTFRVAATWVATETGSWRKTTVEDSVTISNTRAGFVNCDFIRSNYLTQRIIAPDDLLALVGLRVASYDRSRSLRTINLYPGFESSSPHAYVVGGEFMLPNGLMVKPTAFLGLKVDVEDTTAIEGGSTAADADGDPLYFFLRKKPTDSNPVLKFSFLPPDSSGRPTGSVETGYTVNDYGYVGVLFLLDPAGANHAACWGACASRSLESGQRLVSLAADEHSVLSKATALGLLSSGTKSLVGNAATTLPTAKLLRVNLSIAYEAITALSYAYKLRCMGWSAQAQIETSIGSKFTMNFAIELPNQQGNPLYVYVDVGGASGTEKSAFRSGVCALVEDINDPVPMLPTYGAPA